MRIALLRRGRTAAVIAASLGAVGLAGSLPAFASSASPANQAHHATAAAASTRAVLVGCRGNAQVRPRTFVLTCGDGNDVLAGLHWASWPAAGNVAFGTGTERANDCIPNCAQGHVHTYPVLVTAWRGLARAHHPGQRQFTRVTAVYPGKRPTYFRSGGTAYHPQTVTFDLPRA